jgi:hypothetical protein
MPEAEGGLGGLSSVTAHFCGRSPPFSEDDAALASRENRRRRSVALQVASGLPRWKVILTKFLAVRRDSEFCLGMGNLGRSAGFAAVEGFRGLGRLEAGAAIGRLALIHAIAKEGRTEKQQIVTQAHEHHHFHVQWSEE